MVQAQYDFTAFMDAVTNAYGKDVWQGVTTAEDFYSSEFASKITQVDGISATYLKDGSVAYYTYADDVIGAASSPANIINSNTGLTTVNTIAQVPAQTTVSQTTGKVVAESGLKTVSSGSKVTATLGKVATGVMAVGCGVQLGAAIDGALYNANPEFWDSHNMSALNPQTWDSLVSSQGGKDVFNAVFGIDKDTGETQMYVDQNALAYITQYLVSQGAFDQVETGNIDTEVLDTYSYSQNIVDYFNNTLPWKESVFNGVNYLTYSYVYSWKYSALVTDPDVHCFAFANNSGTSNSVFVMMSENPFTYKRYLTYETVPDWSEVNPISASQFTTKSGHTFYIATDTVWYSMTGNFGFNIISPSASPILGDEFKQACGELLFYGTFQPTGQVSGITNQAGATIPSGITESMSIADVITQLQTLYPDLFTNAIQNDVLQEDGTTKTYIYVPCGIPDEIPINETTRAIEPVGGTDLSQGTTTVSETSPESLIQTLLQIITAPDPVNPTQEEEPTNDYPDTGGGITPAIVTPTGSASALYSVYNPSQAELNSFGAWLWSNNFVDQILKVFNNPMEAIIGLHKVFATPVTSGSGDIKVGYLNSGVSANLVSNQYTEINCGTVSLREYFGNVFDYVSTEVYAYLPFVGIVQLNTEDIMRGDITIKYKVDVITGACLCTIEVSRDLAGGQLYTYSGNCAVQYPLSSGSYMGIVSSMLGIAGAVVGTVASGGALMPMALGVGASALAGAKTHVQHSGSVSGNAGAMGIKKPYLIIRRPQTATANFFDSFNGVSYNEYKKLSTLSGFVKVAYANLENFTGTTEEENKEIETLLKGGILL